MNAGQSVTLNESLSCFEAHPAYQQDSREKVIEAGATGIVQESWADGAGIVKFDCGTRVMITELSTKLSAGSDRVCHD